VRGKLLGDCDGEDKGNCEGGESIKGYDRQGRKGIVGQGQLCGLGSVKGYDG